MTNRELFKEAIADAKAVKEAAIVNAKVALEEAFTPFIKEKLSKQIEAMENDDDEVKEEIEDTVDEMVSDSTDDVTEEVTEETLDEEDFLEEDSLEEEDTLEEDSLEEESEESLDDIIALLEEESEESEEDEMGDSEEPVEDDAEVDFENMSDEEKEEYLKNVVELVIDDMIESGELEAGENYEEGDSETKETEEVTDETEEEETLDERKKYGGNKGDIPASKRGKIKKDTAEEEGVEDYKKKMEEELAEAVDTIKTLQKQLQETKLFNAKLLYTNKLFKSKNLTEAQKVKVLSTLDKAETIKEAELVYETLKNGFVGEKKSPIKESRGFASKPAGVATKNKEKEVIVESEMVSRFKKLAGL